MEIYINRYKCHIRELINYKENILYSLDCFFSIFLTVFPVVLIYNKIYKFSVNFSV